MNKVKSRFMQLIAEAEETEQKQQEQAVAETQTSNTDQKEEKQKTKKSKPKYTRENLKEELKKLSTEELNEITKLIR